MTEHFAFTLVFLLLVGGAVQDPVGVLEAAQLTLVSQGLAGFDPCARIFTFGNFMADSDDDKHKCHHSCLLVFALSAGSLVVALVVSLCASCCTGQACTSRPHRVWLRGLPTIMGALWLPQCLHASLELVLTPGVHGGEACGRLGWVMLLVGTCGGMGISMALAATGASIRNMRIGRGALRWQAWGAGRWRTPSGTWLPARRTGGWRCPQAYPLLAQVTAEALSARLALVIPAWSSVWVSIAARPGTRYALWPLILSAWAIHWKQPYHTKVFNVFSCVHYLLVVVIDAVGSATKHTERLAWMPQVVLGVAVLNAIVRAGTAAHVFRVSGPWSWRWRQILALGGHAVPAGSPEDGVNLQYGDLQGDGGSWASDDGAASAAADCPICFEGLWRGRLGVFVGESERMVCRHYFHWRCILGAPTAGQLCCPLCRTAAMDIRLLPAPQRDPEGWFCMCGAESALLTKQELCDALHAVVDADEAAVDSEIDQRWHALDPGGHGAVGLSNLSVEAPAEPSGTAGRKNSPHSPGDLPPPRTPPPPRSREVDPPLLLQQRPRSLTPPRRGRSRAQTSPHPGQLPSRAGPAPPPRSGDA
eukprot:TRINITY_DN26798_c0_g1_i1.p1 TRINITY_DN26798_c0_g1~~TRINITY_DN26798_c0_g1_i1.p1  ORF type:complete len:589 (+),score=25.63 TRINITY_DN26798_c0_g1_i1:80-1846(+)